MRILEELSKEDSPFKLLATIVSSEGSTPRSTGAKMLITDFGKVLGSIGGGCTEGEVINAGMNLLRDKNKKYELFNLDLSGIAECDGMVCGGDMKVMLEKI